MIQENEKATTAISAWNGTPSKTDEQTKWFATFSEKEHLLHKNPPMSPESKGRLRFSGLLKKQEVDFLRI
jgi:hypothetical protein